MRECLKTDREDLIGDWVKMFHHPMMMITTEEKTMKENSSCNLICGTKLFILHFGVKTGQSVQKSIFI